MKRENRQKGMGEYEKKNGYREEEGKMGQGLWEWTYLMVMETAKKTHTQF